MGDDGLLSVCRGEEVRHWWPREEAVEIDVEVDVEVEEEVDGGGVGGVAGASSEGDLSSGDESLRFVFLVFLGASTQVSCKSCLRHLSNGVRLARKKVKSEVGKRRVGRGPKASGTPVLAHRHHGRTEGRNHGMTEVRNDNDHNGVIVKDERYKWREWLAGRLERERYGDDEIMI